MWWNPDGDNLTSAKLVSRPLHLWKQIIGSHRRPHQQVPEEEEEQPSAVGLEAQREQPKGVLQLDAGEEAREAAAQLAASRLHLLDIACFWWQLLSAMAPLQVHQARGARNGFRRFVDRGASR